MTVGDARERQEALDPERSFIVQAPAGSGKTELLIQRFLKLLSRVEQPEQILAMTFTRKAAGEMKTRIMDALARAEAGSAAESAHEAVTLELARTALERDRASGWRLLENPSRFKIQTIDSLCLALTAQIPLLSGTGAPLSAEENPRNLYRETARRILRLAESEGQTGQAARVILRHLDNSKNDFLKRIVQILDKRDQMIPFFDKLRLTPNSRAYLESALAALIESILNEAANLLPAEAVARLPRLASYAAANLAAENPGHPGACLKDLDAIPDPLIASLNQWRSLTNLLLTKEGEWRKKVDKNIGFPPGKTPEGKKAKSDFQDLLESLSRFCDLRDALENVQRLPNPRFSESEWEALEAMLLLLQEMKHVLRGVFRERGKTDFTELSLSALKALGEDDDPTDLLLYLDARIQHILVDEFQDTSYKQRELLQRLTAGWAPGEKRSLFVVGDPMQSIYRFRDAEVGLFLETRRTGIRDDLPLESLTLKTNFRSQKKIVDWVNACFSAIFPKNDERDLGSIRYSESTAYLPAEDRAGALLHPAADPQGVDEAGQIVRLIREIQKDHPQASIAILVRARNHLKEIVRAFHELDVQFKAEEIDPITARPAILDLLALLRALLSPWDRVSWLSILRAPWCGLALEDLHRLCMNDAETPVWRLLNDPARLERLGEDGRKRLRRFAAVMSETQNASRRAHLRDLLESCWTALGGPACLDEAAARDAEVFFDKVSEAYEEGDFETLHRFDAVLETLYANPAAGPDAAVHIMTMHKAKGLEFDFVILPGLGRKEKNEQRRLVYWAPCGNDFLLAPIQETGGRESGVYDFLSRLDREKDHYETLRLLYVSATRAKRQLHLFGHAPENNGEIRPSPNSLLAKLWPHVGGDWERLQRQKTGEPSSSAEPPLRGNWIRRLPATFELPPLKPAIETGVTAELAVGEGEKPSFEWAGSQTRCLGTVLHRCFKDMAEQGLERWPLERINRMAPLLESALLGEGLSQTRTAVEQGIKALENILQDPTARWILAKHREGRSEFSLTSVRENHYVDRTIDRTFVDDNDTRWIIDYKTGEHQGTDLEKFFAEEIERYRQQMDHYEELIRLSGETRPIKKALYYPMHQRLIEIPAR